MLLLHLNSTLLFGGWGFLPRVQQGRQKAEASAIRPSSFTTVWEAAGPYPQHKPSIPQLRWSQSGTGLDKPLTFAFPILACLPRPRLLLSVSSERESFPSRRRIPFSFSLLMSQTWFLSFFPLPGLRFLIGGPWGLVGLFFWWCWYGCFLRLRVGY